MSLLNTEIKDARAVVIEDPANGLCQIGEKNTDALRLWLAVVEPEEHQGETIEWVGWLSANAFEGTDKRLREVFGFDGDYEALAANPNLFAGRPCKITTEYEEYNNKTRLKVKWLNHPDSSGGAAAAPLDPVKARGLAAQLSARSKALAKAAGAAGARPASATKTPADKEDEITY